MSDQNVPPESHAPYRPLNNAVQIAYVTNDIDRAREMFGTIYGVARWLDLAAMGEFAGRMIRSAIQALLEGDARLAGFTTAPGHGFLRKSEADRRKL